MLLITDEKTTQIPDFFVETLIALAQFDSEVGDLPGYHTVIEQRHFSHILTKGIKPAPHALFI